MAQVINTNGTHSKPLPPKKRIIICCDGTWQSANHGVQSTPSNIAKISRAIANYSHDPEEGIVQQVVWYDAGVGTSTDSVKTRIAGFITAHQGTWGEGLDENVCEAYNFIVNNYNKGDELYFFGFSRGAYTARAAAGLVATVGICPVTVMDDFYKMYQAYKSKKAADDINNTAWAQSDEGRDWLAECDTEHYTIQAVGVFDTVGSVGWPNNALFSVEQANQPFAFHNTDVHEKVKNAFQAIALDEHRASFPPTVWGLPEGSATLPEGRGTRLIQCWFPGYHINCGGGSGDFQQAVEKRRGDFETMANITFAWMVDRVNQYTPLRFDEDAIYILLEKYAENIEDLVEAQNTANGHQHSQIYRGWGTGPLVDSMTWKMALTGSKTRTPAEYNKDNHHISHEYIHPVVAFAMESGYKSKALEGFKREKASDGTGYVWRKTYTPQSEQGIVGRMWSYINGRSEPAQQEVHLEIPEYIIPLDEGAPGDRKCAWGESMERHVIRADTRKYLRDNKVEKDDRKSVIDSTLAFMKKLDADNGLKPKSENAYDFFNLKEKDRLFLDEDDE